MPIMYRRRDDGRRFVMGGHGLVRPGTLFAEVSPYYLERRFFEKVEIEEPEPEIVPAPVPELEPDLEEEPWEGYDETSARAIIEELDACSLDELHYVKGYEEGHKDRVTVLRKVRSQLSEHG